jgi:hypothetical protein
MSDQKRPINLVRPDVDPEPPNAVTDDVPDLRRAAINILKFPEKVTLIMGLVLLGAPLGLWLALVVPRVNEITGAGAASGHKGSDGLLIGVMLAIISVVVSLLATVIRAYAHNEVDERIDLERTDVDTLRASMDEAQRVEAEAVETRNKAFGETDAVVTTYRDHQNAIKDHFWEGFFARHANDASIYGTWSDKDTVEERFKTKHDVLFNTPEVVTPKAVQKFILDNRSGRATAHAYQAQEG